MSSEREGYRLLQWGRPTFDRPNRAIQKNQSRPMRTRVELVDSIVSSPDGLSIVDSLAPNHCRRNFAGWGRWSESASAGT